LKRWRRRQLRGEGAGRALHPGRDGGAGPATPAIEAAVQRQMTGLRLGSKRSDARSSHKPAVKLLSEYSAQFFDADEYLRRMPPILTSLAYIWVTVAESASRRQPLIVNKPNRSAR
jgi:hypothetical protein